MRFGLRSSRFRACSLLIHLSQNFGSLWVVGLAKFSAFRVFRVRFTNSCPSSHKRRQFRSSHRARHVPWHQGSRLGRCLLRDLVALDTMEGEECGEDGLEQLLKLALKADEKPAVLQHIDVLTFAELTSRVVALSARLEDLPGFLGICVHRTFALVVSLLASLRCRKVFIPLDPGFPAKRLAYILEDACPGALLLEETVVSQHPELWGSCRQILVLDRSGQCQETTKTGPHWEGEEVPAAAAYCIYTSGSTGKPKGVLVSRPNLHLGPVRMRPFLVKWGFWDVELHVNKFDLSLLNTSQKKSLQTQQPSVFLADFF